MISYRNSTLKRNEYRPCKLELKVSTIQCFLILHEKPSKCITQECRTKDPPSKIQWVRFGWLGLTSTRHRSSFLIPVVMLPG